MDALGPTDLLWRAVGRPADPRCDGRGPCALCGRGDLPVAAWRTALPRTFNDGADFRGEHLCCACLAYYVRAGRGRTLRSTHLLVTEREVLTPSTVEVRRRFIEGDWPAPPFAVTVACSYKKHLLPRARVATTGTRFPVTLELDTGEVGVEDVAALVTLVELFLAAGWSRDEVAGGRFASRAGAAGVELWRTEGAARRARARSFGLRLAARVATGRGADG